MNKLTIVLIVVAILAMAGMAMAATVTSNFDVTANAISTCRITGAATTLAFGAYDPTSSTAADAGPGSFKFRCTKNTAYNIYITGTRTMIGNTSENLTFELYSDSGRTTVFPASKAASTPVTSAGNAEQTTSYWGRIPALQDVSAGNFTATVTATVEF